jgi:PKD repeat protein
LLLISCLVLAVATAGLAMPADGIAGQVSAWRSGGAPDRGIESSRDSATANPDQPLDISIRVLSPPALGQVVGVEVTVAPWIDAPQLDLDFVIPPDLAVPGATSAWRESVAAGASLTRSTQVQLRREGLFELRARASFAVEGGGFAKHAVVFLDVRKEGSTVLAERPTPPPLHSGRAKQVAGTASTPTGPPVETSDGFRVYGWFVYSDMPYNTNGFTGARVYRPIRCAEVTVYDQEDYGPDEEWPPVWTNCNGYFEVWVPNNDDGPLQEGRDIFVKVRSANDCTVEVTDNGFLWDTVYDVRSDTREDWSGGDLYIGTLTPDTDDLNAVFNIMDTILAGCQWASGLAGERPAKVYCRWEPGYDDHRAHSSHYHSDRHIIDLLDLADNPQQFDDDVILHEYGHHVAHVYSYDHSPGRGHYWSADYDSYYRTRPDDKGGPLSLLESQQLCWSEGWATYASSAIRDRPTYVDNFSLDPGTDPYWVNLEVPTEHVTGDECEGAVAATLWDIYDGNDDLRDTLSLGSDEIWGIFDWYFEDSLDCTLRTFWDGWLGSGYGELWGLWAIFHERGVNYIVEPVGAKFLADVTSGSAPLLVQFTDWSEGGPDTWSWDFGDGTGSAEKNPSHLYVPLGEYTVSLTASSSLSGFSDTETWVEYIKAGGSVDFVADLDCSWPPITVTFTDVSTTGHIVCWDFGDDSQSGLYGEPIHTYEFPGRYTIKAVAVVGTSGQCAMKPQYIHVRGVCADFTANWTGEGDPWTVQFTDLSGGRPGADCWWWDFGDGTAGSDQQNPQHTYTAPGAYRVTLRASTPWDCDTMTKADYITVLGPPVAEFEGTPMGGALPLTVNFRDFSTARPTFWLWEFGDGGTSAEQNPTHQYSEVHTYPVTLTVSNDYGSDTETKERYIRVTFTDITRDYWAALEILACVDAGIVKGYGDGTYRPTGIVTRDQMAVYIARALVIPTGDAAIPDPEPPPTFSDVLADHWAYKHIEYCVANHIVVGYAVDNTYRPGEKVNRGQMAAYVARAIYSPRGIPPDDLPGYAPPAVPRFPDVPTDHPFYKYVEYVAGVGVVQGYGDGTYRPADLVNRGQMAVYVARAFKLPI